MEHSLYGYLVFYLAFSALTGSILFLIWIVMEKALRKYLSARFSVAALEICLVCFLVPVIYFKNLYFHFKLENNPQNMSFQISPDMDVVFRILVLIWLAGFVYTMARYIRSLIQFERNLKETSVQITDEHMLAILDEYKRRLFVRRRVTLLHKQEERTAFACGVFRVRIVLSDAAIREEETFRIVLLHEMLHVSRRDVLMKHISIVLRCLYWFHLLAHLIVVALTDYLEYRCDELCCLERYGGPGQQTYFRALYNVASEKKRQAFFVYAGFSETWKQLKRRIDYMSKKKKLSGIRKLCLILAAVLALNGGLVAAYAASDKAAWKYYGKNDKTMEQIDWDEEAWMREASGTVVIDEPAEEDDPNITEIDITDEVMKNRSTTFSVTLPPMYRKTVQIYMVKGDVLCANSIIDPSTKTARLGIIRPNNTKSYVSGKGSLSGKFTAATSDYHKLYVENPNGSGTITVHVNYWVK